MFGSLRLALVIAFFFLVFCFLLYRPITAGSGFRGLAGGGQVELIVNRHGDNLRFIYLHTFLSGGFFFGADTMSVEY